MLRYRCVLQGVPAQTGSQHPGSLFNRLDPASTGLALFGLEVLVPNGKLLPAVAAAQPAGVAMAVSVNHREDDESTYAFTFEGFWWAWHVIWWLYRSGLGQFGNTRHPAPCR